ncbi:unnamed protein product [Adineta ricciae]|uniref:Uncharacterized protein n=1 Tax=Adineta ricciae TaxID=249248 RepID=A0A814N0S5_ADIRI|nr:unnamed protein product [Adineta ricciae]
MQSAIFSIIVATILLQSSTLSFGFLFDKPKTSTPTTTTTSRSALSALVFTSRPSQTSTSSSFNANSFHSSDSIHSGSSSSFGSTNFLPSHIRIRQTNMSNKDQELAVKLTMDALKRFGYKIGTRSQIAQYIANEFSKARIGKYHAVVGQDYGVSSLSSSVYRDYLWFYSTQQPQVHVLLYSTKC